MVIPYRKSASAWVVVLSMAAASVQAAAPSAAIPASPASASKAPASNADADLGAVAHPAALVLATIAAISFVTRRLRD